MRKITPRKVSKNLEASSSFNPQEKIRTSLSQGEGLGDIYNLKIDTINPYSRQARKHFDEAELQELASTIELYGVRQPITVIASDDTGKYEVISGERRLKAAKIAGLLKIPAIVLDSEENACEISLIENIQRKDLSPFEFGETLANLIDDKKYENERTLGVALGLSKSKVSEALSVNKLPEDVKQRASLEGKTSRRILRQLCSAHTKEEMFSILDQDGLQKEEMSAEGVSAQSKRRAKRPLCFRTINGMNVVTLARKDLSGEERVVLIHNLKNIIKELEGGARFNQHSLEVDIDDE